MPIKGKFKYDAEMVENIYQQLKTCEAAGEPMEYEVRVDQQRVVPRTTKSALFYSFDPFVKASTRSVEIVYYTGESNFNERYIFWFEGAAASGSNESTEGSLSGFEPEIKIRERVKKEYELTNLLKEKESLLDEIADLEDELEESEEENEKIKGALEEERAKSTDMWNSLIKELGSGMLGTALKSKLGIGGGGLSGTEEESISDTKVNISKEESADEETKKAVAFAGYLKERFQGIQYQRLMFIIDKLAQDNTRIEEVWELITEEGGQNE